MRPSTTPNSPAQTAETTDKLQTLSTVVTMLDYTQLHEPVTKADISEFKSRHEPRSAKLAKLMQVVLYVLIAGISMMIFFVGVLLISHNGFTFSFLPLGMWLLIFAGVVYGAQLILNARYQKLVRLERFANVNGLEFKYDTIAAYYSGMIFDEGHSREVNEVLKFPSHTEIGNYTYVTGSGKNRSVHRWAYMKVKLPRRLPHMVLDAKKNNIFGRFSNLTDTFDRSQTLSLEGDFNDHFTLYAPKQYERDALYVFTPDVMARLIDSGSGFDMEVIDDELYIYRATPFNLSSETELRTLLGIVSTISSELKDQTGYYADERVGDRTQNIIAAPGARLKHGVNWLAVFIIVVMVVFYTMDFWIQLIAWIGND